MDKKREIALYAVASAASDFCHDHRFSPEMQYDELFEEMVRALNYLRSLDPHLAPTNPPPDEDS